MVNNDIISNISKDNKKRSPCLMKKNKYICVVIIIIAVLSMLVGVINITVKHISQNDEKLNATTINDGCKEGSLDAEMNIASHAKIQSLIDEISKKSGIPDCSVAVVQGDLTDFFNYSKNGQADINSQSLYQIGSNTKAFTGLAINLLEEQGKLSHNDYVSDYFPNFHVFYQGTEVKIKVSDLLFQTSGFTNSEAEFATPSQEMSILDEVELVNGANLRCQPSTQYNYSNINYNLLGAIIEQVSGKTYTNFMQENILEPLGLNNTYVNPEMAFESGKIVNGSRPFFFTTQDYDVPIISGKIPSGYIISNTEDMAKWMRVQMGLTEIPSDLKTAVSTSHLSSSDCMTTSGDKYASGWLVTSDNIIYHSGGTPNYSSYVIFDKETDTGVCILTNINLSASTEYLARSIFNMLTNRKSVSYSSDVWTVFNKVFSVVSVVSVIVILLFLFMLLFNKFKKVNYVFFIILASICVILTITMLILMPIILASSWNTIAVWAPPSLIIGIILFSIMTVLIVIATIKVFYHRNSS